MPPSREEIAEIIDPGCLTWPEPYEQARKNAALAKADAILALLPDPDALRAEGYAQGIEAAARESVECGQLSHRAAIHQIKQGNEIDAQILTGCAHEATAIAERIRALIPKDQP